VLVSQAAPATSLAEPRRVEKHIQNRSASLEVVQLGMTEVLKEVQMHALESL
jgi:hypothetical protein